MKSKINAEKIIQLIKSRRGIETKQICAELGLTPAQFTNAQPFIKKDCYRETKKWRMIVVDEVPARIRRNPVATIIYRMMPVSQKGLKERMGMSKDAIWRAIKLLKEHKLIHITGYESSNTTIFPMFAKGYGIDATRPDSKTLAKRRAAAYKARNPEKVAEIAKKYKENNRELLRFKQMARYWAKADELNAKAREKAKLKREGFVKPVILATQWRGGNPFLGMVQ